jgi:aminotransferase EvaB
MIRTFDYQKTFSELEQEIVDVIRRVLHSGSLILGPETESFEQEFAKYIGAKHCIGVTSGTTALHLALTALSIESGDEILTVPNTCVPTVSAVRLAGAEPHFTDVRETDLMMDTDKISESVSSHTRCLLPVHLWGQSVDMNALMSQANLLDIPVIEDCAQACGTTYGGIHAGLFGIAGCFSFYPTKNLGAYGDAGAIVTNDDELADRLRKLRTYGMNQKGQATENGMNARISEIQAAILRVKLKYLPGWLNRRRTIARLYHEMVSNPNICMPMTQEDVVPSYHQFVVRCKNRQKVIDRLSENDIGWAIHYATPIHKMPAFDKNESFPVAEKAAAEILSLPVHEALEDWEVEKVAKVLNSI